MKKNPFVVWTPSSDKKDFHLQTSRDIFSILYKLPSLFHTSNVFYLGPTERWSTSVSSFFTVRNLHKVEINNRKYFARTGFSSDIDCGNNKLERSWVREITNFSTFRVKALCQVLRALARNVEKFVLSYIHGCRNARPFYFDIPSAAYAELHVYREHRLVIDS